MWKFGYHELICSRENDILFWKIPLLYLYPFFSISLLKGTGPSFIQTWKLIPHECFVPKFALIGSVVVKKKT